MRGCASKSSAKAATCAFPERELELVSPRERVGGRERERKKVCVCVRERERETDREREERDCERESQTQSQKACAFKSSTKATCAPIIPRVRLKVRDRVRERGT